MLPSFSNPNRELIMRISDTRRGLRALGAGIALSAFTLSPAGAQQVNGTPGSPTATTTIPGNQLPPPPPKFGGVITESATSSKPWWPPLIVPPKGAPNVLLIMTDDQGYGVSGTFGGVVPTPAMDRIAKAGLRYTQFHSTALCSPTRAALITGRNHHSVGFGVIGELSTGYPGYDSIIGPENATIGAILKENGYATSWFGKNHNTPAFQYSVAGPFEQWPSGMGFQYFYGFMGGETDQWTPYLFRDHTQIFPWVGRSDYNLTTDLADEAIKYMSSLNAAAPDKPFFLYYVPGGTHSPHQPKKEWVEKFKGKFDMGWEKLREQIFANQKRLGVIPENTQLTPWPDDLPKWDSLSLIRKKLYAREAEVFAGYAAYTDHEIGRVIQAVEDMGKLDDTLIIYISGDNGTSAEGTLEGTPNQMTAYNGILDLPEAEAVIRPSRSRARRPWSPDELHGFVRVGQELVVRQLAFGAVAVFLVAHAGLERTEHAEFAFHRDAAEMRHVGDGPGDADIVVPVAGRLAVSLERAVHHYRGEAGLDRGHAGRGLIAVVEMHADRNLRMDFGDRVHHVAEHHVIGVGARTARGLDDDRRVERGGGLHDGERLLHVVDVEGRHPVIVLRRMVEQLTQRNPSHSYSPCICRRPRRPIGLHLS